MAITVGDIYRNVQSFTESDMRKLIIGDFTKDTQVSLAAIARFGNKPLSIYATGKEGNKFTKLLPDEQKNNLVSLQPKLAHTILDNTKDTSYVPKLPMDISVFGYQRAIT